MMSNYGGKVRVHGRDGCRIHDNSIADVEPVHALRSVRADAVELQGDYA